MRLIHFSRLDKSRPFVELTRKPARNPMTNVTVAHRTLYKEFCQTLQSQIERT